MADSKKYDGGQWEHSLRKMTTATADIEPTIYTDGTAITSYTIKGNTVQNGTPSPSNPVEVSGVGVRTENLTFKTITQANINSSGTIIAPDNYTIAIAKVEQGKTYSGNGWLYAFYENEPNIGSTSYNGQRYSSDFLNVTAPIDGYVALRVTDASQPMINGGSQKKPFEPLGYKIPISNGQQTIDIYIGDLPLLKSLDGTAVDEISNGTLTRRVDSDGSVLPTPTTTQITMPSIPTTEGANTITVDTTVQPSEFTATWTGWHDASVKEWDGSIWG